MFTLRDAQTTATEVKRHASKEDAVSPAFGPKIGKKGLSKRWFSSPVPF